MVDAPRGRASGGVAACPFCGQPLLNKKATEHLEHQGAAYEAQLRQQAEAEARSRANARVQAVEKAVRADSAKQLKLAGQESANAVALLNRQLQEAKKHQTAKVQAEVQKQLAEAKKGERDRLEDQFSKREKQLDLTLKKLQEQNSELSRRVERLSAGDRGEFNEEEIVIRLARAFPDDDIKRTRRGQPGADIFQRVKFRTDGDLTEAGLIIYECKDTLHWSNSFTAQMRAEAKLHGTPYAILVSRCFPPGLRGLAVVDDIVVVDPARVLPLAEIMRRMVVNSYRAGAVAGSQAEKTAELFRFISSTEFGQAFDTLVEAVETLEGLLTRERRSHQKTWSEQGHLYQSVSDTVVEIDQRFKSILESKAKKGTVRLLTREKASA
jgi:hypothetical protein